MPDGNGLNFDTSLPGDQSSVRYGAQEIRNLRTALKNWSGNGAVNSSVFTANSEQATIKSSAITSDMLGTPSSVEAAVGNLSPDVTNTSVLTYSAVSINSKGQVIKGKKATLDELATISASKLAGTNIAPSATPKQFLRTNSAASGSEWVTNAMVSHWNTAQATSFMELVSTQRTTADLYGAAWDGWRFLVCGAALKCSRELYRFDSMLAPASTTFKDVVIAASPVTNLPKGIVVGAAGGNAALAVSTATITGASDGRGSWSSRTFSSGGNYPLNAVATSNTSYVAVGDTGTIYRFPAGSLSTSNINPEILSTSGSSLYDVAFGNGYYVAVGQSGTVRVFTDSQQTNVDTLLASTVAGSTTLRSVVFSSHLQKWVLVGDGGKVCVSNTANPLITAWTSTVLGGGSFTFNSVESANGIILAVGDNGNIWRSVDAVTWTNVSTNVVLAESNPLWQVTQLSSSYKRVAYCAGTWVIVGAGVALVGGDLPLSYFDEARSAGPAAFGTGGTGKNNSIPTIGYVLPHGLGETPVRLSAFLVNIDPQASYSPGDVVPIPTTAPDQTYTPVSANSSYVTWAHKNLYVGTAPAADTGLPTTTGFFTQYVVSPKEYKWELTNAPLGLVLAATPLYRVDAACWRVRLSASLYS